MSDPRTLQDTLMDAQGGLEGDGAPVPGLVLIFTRGKPSWSVFSLGDGSIVLGRDEAPDAVLGDPRMSRRHAEVSFDGASFQVRDLGSRNGTFVDGEQVRETITSRDLHFLRTGSSIFLVRRDIRPFQSSEVLRVNGVIMGPTLLAAWRLIARHARSSDTLFLHGESGVGKERAARAFHSLSHRSAEPLVAVNCSAIPEGMVERLFFGTKRGAYSGADTDAPGYVQSAHRGVLFLDEVAELDLSIQAKLLRVLESKEVLPLGASRPTPVDFAICAATHKDLRAEVARGRFRQDLYFRMGRPEVTLPPLRQRLEELPWLIEEGVKGAERREEQGRAEDQEGAGLFLPDEQDRGAGGRPRATDSALAVHGSFVETCLRRRWPGNVRELLLEVRSAAHEAMARGSKWLKDVHLDPHAGMGFEDQLESAESQPSAMKPDKATIVDALQENLGNISRAARSLHVHRTQLRRWIAHYEIDVSEIRNR